MKKSLLFGSILLIAAFVLNSCEKKEGCTDPSATNYDSGAEKDDGSCEYPAAEGTMKLVFNPVVDGETMQMDKDYDLEGLKYQYTLFKFYISNIELMDETGEWIPAPELHYLVEPDEDQNLKMEAFNVGTYTKIKFYIGVDPRYNTEEGELAKMAGDYSLDHPLSSNNAMYWAWKPGYGFFKIEGKIDKDNNGSYAEDDDFIAMHAGLDPLYTMVERDINLNLGNNEEKSIKFNIDMERLYEGLDMTSDDTDQHPMGIQMEDYQESTILMGNLNAAFGDPEIQ